MNDEMKSELTKALGEAGELCEISGYTKQAQWFRDRIQMVQQFDHTQLPDVLKEIKGMLAGMGSFSDLPLSPSPDSGMTREQARHRQWDLVTEIDAAIEKMN